MHRIVAVRPRTVDASGFDIPPGSPHNPAMDVCVLTRDLMFFTAVEGVAGAMGHAVRQAESPAGIGSPALLIADLGSAGVAAADLAAACDPLRTAVFAPHVQVEVFSGARAQGFAHVYRRGALATELPRLLAEYAV